MNISLKGGQTGIQQPLTVHIQQTEQGARLMIPAGQLSQLPGKSREGSGVQLECNLTGKKNFVFSDGITVHICSFANFSLVLEIQDQVHSILPYLNSFI